MAFLATVCKELTLLSRDRAGLLVLFLMPMLLVLVLSLIQDNVFRATAETVTRALFVNLDQGPLGAELAVVLEKTGTLELVENLAGQRLNTEAARQAVFSGDYQFAILIPADFTVATEQAAEVAILSALRGETVVPAPAQLRVFFDPTVRGVYRSAVSSALHRGVLALTMARTGAALGRLLPAEMNRTLAVQLQAYGAEGLIEFDLPTLAGGWENQVLVELNEESAAPGTYLTLPTSVQQNVPAWTLFGMFFIVIPMAGTIIRERQDGTLTRLLTMPVSITSLLFGKVFAYLLVCLGQFGLMLLVGKFVMPLLGTPELDLGTAPAALLLVAASSALAACGYGLLVGVLARSYDQASTFGAVSVVIAAALGGVMVPVYVMPRMMQTVSVVSPLGWGLDAFLNIFVREGNLLSVLPQVAALTTFSLGCLLCAGLVFSRWRRGL